MDVVKELKESNAEKMAIDQLYVEALKAQIQLRKLLILKDSEIADLNKTIDSMKQNLECLKQEFHKEEVLLANEI